MVYLFYLTFVNVILDTKAVFVTYPFVRTIADQTDTVLLLTIASATLVGKVVILHLSVI